MKSRHINVYVTFQIFERCCFFTFLFTSFIVYNNFLHFFSSRQFSCACSTGFSLTEDLLTCSTKFNEVLLVATTQGLSKISLDLPDLSDTVIPIYNNISKYYLSEPNIVAVDYDPIGMYIHKKFREINFTGKKFRRKPKKCRTSSH